MDLVISLICIFGREVNQMQQVFHERVEIGQNVRYSWSNLGLGDLKFGRTLKTVYQTWSQTRLLYLLVEVNFYDKIILILE
jgi:hypothetical protein